MNLWSRFKSTSTVSTYSWWTKARVVAAAILLPLTAGYGQDDNRKVVVPVVDAHVGGDGTIAKTFTYSAPPGYVIDNFRLIERSKGGDVSYAPVPSDDARTLTVSYKLHSKTIRGPFKVLLDTKTAFLKLDLELTLRRASLATKPPEDENQSGVLNLFRVYSPYVILVSILSLTIIYFLGSRLRLGVASFLIRFGTYLGNPQK